MRLFPANTRPTRVLVTTKQSWLEVLRRTTGRCLADDVLLVVRTYWARWSRADLDALGRVACAVGVNELWHVGDLSADGLCAHLDLAMGTGLVVHSGLEWSAVPWTDGWTIPSEGLVSRRLLDEVGRRGLRVGRGHRLRAGRELHLEAALRVAPDALEASLFGGSPRAHAPLLWLGSRYRRALVVVSDETRAHRDDPHPSLDILVAGEGSDLVRALCSQARYRSVTVVGDRAARVLDTLDLEVASLPDCWPGAIDDLAPRRVIGVRR